MRQRLCAVALVLVLVSLALRVYRLDGQSLWYDEGNSVALAQRDLATIINSAAADIHPPLYYLLLHGWVRLVGTSDFAVRLLSALLGVLTVLLTFVIGRRLFGPGAGLLAAALAALSPFLVYYAQEARMYALATFLCTLAMYLVMRLIGVHSVGPGLKPAVVEVSTTNGQVSDLLVRGTRLSRWGLWLAYVVVTTAALYSHYFAATVVLAQDVAVALAVLWTLFAGRTTKSAIPSLRALGPLLAAQVVVALLYLPWLPVMAGQFSNWPAISEFYDLPTLLTKMFFVFSLGFTVEPQSTLSVWWVGLPVLVFANALFLGAVHANGQRYSASEGSAEVHESRLARLIALTWLFIPVLVMFILSLRRPMYNPKFLLVAAPAFYLLLGRGVQFVYVLRGLPTLLWRIRHVLILLAIAILAAASLISLNTYYFDARYARDDYRGLVQAIAAGERNGDAIMLHAPGQTDIFGHYYRGQLPIYLLPRQRPLDEPATLGELADIAGRHARVWVVYYGDEQADPRRVIGSWLEEHTYKASDRWFGNVRLVLYALPAAQTGTMQPLDVRFGSAIRLLGYRLGAAQAVAGEIVPLTLYWQTTSFVAERYTVFVHVLSSQEALWGQRDSEPGGGLRPTTTWQPGETIQDNYGLPVLAGAPPGEYQIEIGMYLAATGQRVPLTDGAGRTLGDRVLFGPLIVARPAEPPSLASLGMQHTAMTTVGPLYLLGYSLARLGQDPGAAEFAGGDLLHLTLFWRAPAQPIADLTVVVQVLDAAGKVVRQREAKPADGAYPSNGWVADEIVRDQHRFGLDGLGAGTYRLVVELREASGRSVGRTTLGEMRVR